MVRKLKCYTVMFRKDANHKDADNDWRTAATVNNNTPQDSFDLVFGKMEDNEETAPRKKASRVV